MTLGLVPANWIDLLGTVVLAGGAGYAALVAPLSGRGQRAVLLSALVVAATLMIELGATAWRLSGVAASGGSSVLWKLLGTQWGMLWIARLSGLAAILALPTGSAPQLVVVALWLLAKSLQGHAGANDWVPAVVDWVHLSAACAWAGGLVQFLSSPAADSALAERLRRVATLSFAALVLAGVCGAFLHVPSPVDLVSTTYGWVLLAKTAMAIWLLTLGARNHFVYVPALQRRDEAAGRNLWRVVRLEIFGGALVLLLSAILASLPLPTPPAP